MSYDSNLRPLWPLVGPATIVASCGTAVVPAEPRRAALLRRKRSECDPRLVPCQGCATGSVEDSEGVWVPEPRASIRGHRVNAIDATGAGDCFDGAFAARMVAGDDALAAARYANAAAALATTGYGAVDPLPRHADVAAFLKQGAT